MKKNLMAMALMLRVCWGGTDSQCADWVGRQWAKCNGKMVHYYVVNIDGKLSLVDPKDVEKVGN